MILSSGRGSVTCLLTSERAQGQWNLEQFTKGLWITARHRQFRVSAVKKRIFTFQDQIVFAEISGDRNPLHMDALAARRFLFGGPVVHGIHLLLWALETWLQDKAFSVFLRSLVADFFRPLDVGAEVSCELVSEHDGCVRIRLLSGGFTVAVVAFEWFVEGRAASDIKNIERPQRSHCKAMSAAEVMGASGTMRLELDVAAAAGVFPNLTHRFPLLQLAQIATTSRLVGMECPGLHSVYSKLKLKFEIVEKCAPDAPVLRDSI